MCDAAELQLAVLGAHATQEQAQQVSLLSV